MITDETLETSYSHFILGVENGDKQRLQAALTAAYPLIRAQVLSECAAVCDKIERVHRMPKDYEEDLVAEGAKECAQAIRALAEKGTDNGTL